MPKFERFPLHPLLIIAMSRSKSKDFLIRTTKNTIYITLMCLGWYLIWHGNVWDRYHGRKTNFAEYDEPITELPTIVTWAENAQGKLQFDQDFSLRFCTRVSHSHCKELGYILKEGNNSVEGLGLHLQVHKTKQIQRIMPLVEKSFGHLKFARFSLKYIFKKNDSSTTVKLFLSTKNNSNCDGSRVTFWDGNMDIMDGWDGDINVQIAKIGERKILAVRPEKYLYMPDVKTCRDKPFNELLLKKTFKQMQENNCSRHCLPSNFFLCSDELESKNIPHCWNKSELKCFSKARKMVFRETLKKPCTKLQYSNVALQDTRKWESSKTEFRIKFAEPYHVKVKEEYLLHDLVSMIGAVGGTMGICIGFSFTEVFNFLMDLALLWASKIMKARKNKNSRRIKRWH